MTPLYEYRCTCGHKCADLRKPEHRNDPTYCQRCLGEMQLVMSLPAKRTDGIYSYEPNVGDPVKHERWEATIKKRKQETGK